MLCMIKRARQFCDQRTVTLEELALRAGRTNDNHPTVRVTIIAVCIRPVATVCPRSDVVSAG